MLITTVIVAYMAYTRVVCASMQVLFPVSRAQVTGRAEFTSEPLRMREINAVNIRC